MQYAGGSTLSSVIGAAGTGMLALSVVIGTDRYRGAFREEERSAGKPGTAAVILRGRGGRVSPSCFSLLPVYLLVEL